MQVRVKEKEDKNKIENWQLTYVRGKVAKVKKIKDGLVVVEVDNVQAILSESDINYEV